MDDEEEDENEFDDGDAIDDNARDFPIPTPPDLLSITRTLNHDRYVGNYSKYIFKRTETPDNIAISLCPEEEISHYIQYHLHPLLTSILGRGSANRHFLWLAFEISFMQMLDLSETCSRWSSLRNRHFFTPSLHSDEEIRRYITDFTLNFAEETLSDIFEMTSLYQSGWIYQCVL